MKKVFTVATIFCVFVLNTNAGEMNVSTNLEVFKDEECTTSAWEYGTRQGGGNEDIEYFYTNWYYEVYCS